jgi:Na+/H+ antiporter NhaC
MANKVHGNMGVLIFIVLLGMIVYLMNLSGATHRYAQWAGRRITSRRQTLLATMALGIIIFVDDYFNCLTVGTVMGPIADRNKISREKLAYIIDCTAAPICIIAPISSWAAAVTSSLPDGSAIDGFKLFLQAIPYNFYSLFTLALILITSILAVDFGKMRRYELEARARQIVQEAEQEQEQARGKVVDLILPIVGLIVFSLIAMLYTGGFFDGGMTIGAAFADCDAIMGLAMGAFYTVILMVILYLPRKIVTP